MTFHSDPALLPLTAAGIGAQTHRPWRTLVHVNDATGDEERAVEAGFAAAPDVSVSASHDNLGFAGGHNRALKLLFDGGAEAVLVLNPDLRLAPDALHELWTVARSAGGRCLTGPLLELGEEGLRPTGLIDSAGIRWTRTARHLDALQGEPLSHAPAEASVVAGLTGACVLVPREAYDAVVEASGEFFDADFVAYREDAELGLRCQALGIPCLLVPAARGVHGRGLRGTSRSSSAAVNRLGVQNRFLIRFKHGHRRPGNAVLSSARDVVVLAGAALVERSSWAGVRSAWSLRPAMRAKRRLLDRHRR